MKTKLSFAQNVINFNKNLSSVSFDLPDGFRIVNPFIGEFKEQTEKNVKAFYERYFNGNNPRFLILGSSPARGGTAVTGIPFEDFSHLQLDTCALIKKTHINKSSSAFLYEVIEKYGGIKEFYANFYMNFVCPLGIVKTNDKGNEINCNYYDSRKIQQCLYGFIVDSIRSIISFGIDTSVCFCIGSGKNYSFLNEINNTNHFFTRIIPLEHPRFIMQYNSHKREYFLEKYLKALRYKTRCVENEVKE